VPEPADGTAEASPSAPPAAASSGSGIAPTSLRVHYYRRDGRYAGWGCHPWGDTPVSVSWETPLQPTSFDGFGAVYDLPLHPGASTVDLIIHKREDKDQELAIDIARVASGRSTVAELWLVAGTNEMHTRPPDITRVPFGDLTRSAAHWLNARTIAWRLPTVDRDTGAPHKFALHTSAEAGMSAEDQLVYGAEGSIPLHAALDEDLPEELVEGAPHLRGSAYLQVPHLSQAQIAEVLRGQVIVSCHSAEDEAIEATGLQVAGVLDECFFYDGPLGARVGAEGVDVALWAPTAQRVELLLWDGPRGGEAQVLPMEDDMLKGVWHLTGPASWEWKYYTLRVTVYSPWTQQVEVTETTDPYSRSLAADGLRSQFVDLAHPQLTPKGWEQEASPALTLGRFTDMAIYELHIRDFSATDDSVPAALRGKYLAFCEPETAGVKHLAGLAGAGITHLHLLPTYDFGSVPERAEDQASPPTAEMESCAPQSEEQQERIVEIAAQDAYNWGYDPVHWGVPEGSYATDPDGGRRVLEFRQMVQSLHALGLRVVLDVVYNHTYQSGPHNVYSVLDKIVPGYYHRRGETGQILHSSCCNNTATEHLMCERMVVDDCVHWARAYKVDGYRFDIMGHLLTRTMRKVRDAIRALTLEADGVDGAGMYLYGEAWDFGEMACNRRGHNACQLNIHGMGFGSFNDRFRDSVIGGTPFQDPRLQGVVTGLATEMRTDFDQGSTLDQLERLMEYSDWLRLSLAGGLRDFMMEDRFGRTVKGMQVLYGAVPAAYTREPWECVNYAACHDNETLYDQVILKSRPGLPLAEKLKMYRMALAFVALGQGVPFFHAGDDILRSKSLDRDSYDSGDWFNRLDWTMQRNNFGVGLPPAPKNSAAQPIHTPLLANASLVPAPGDIAHTHAVFCELLAIRRSSRLFHLPSSVAIQNQVRFHNTGPRQIPGVIVMEVVSGDEVGAPAEDAGKLYSCPEFRRVLVVFNPRPTPYYGEWPTEAAALELHPLHLTSVDAAVREGVAIQAVTREVEVPARAAAVFVEKRAQLP